MPSKELTHEELKAIVAAKMADPNTTAADILSTILAALQEPTPAMQLVVSANWGRRTWAEYQQVLAASALGEKAE